MKTQTGLSWRELISPEMNVCCPCKAKDFFSILLTISLSADHTVVLAYVTAWVYTRLNIKVQSLGPNKIPVIVLRVLGPAGTG